MAPNLRGILPLAMIRLWSRLHGAQLVGFQKPTGFQSVHVLDFKSTYMTPKRFRGFSLHITKEKNLMTPPWETKCLITSYRPAMPWSLLNKRHSEHDARLTRDFTLSHRWFIIEHHTRQPYESNLNWSIMASYDFFYKSTI